MAKFRSILFAAVCLAAIFSPSAPAQTQPLTILTYQGNGQMVCAACPQWQYQSFDPLVAKVVDANGVPVPGTTVNWYVSLGNGYLANFTTTTDNNGLTNDTYWVNETTGNPALTFISNEVVASIGNSSATFYETQVLALPGGVVDVVAEPYPIGNTEFPISLAGAAGTTGTALQIYAHSYGVPIPGVELRLINSQTSPSVTCAPSSSSFVGDPGTAVSDTTGIVTCNPILAGSGSGQFQVLIGGVAAWSLTGAPMGYKSFDNNNLSVTAPSPASIQVISGNSQTATAGQSLSSPLVAIVRDTNGNLLASQSVTWTVSPSNAGTLIGASNASSSTGQVQTGFALSNSANGTVTVTVAVTGNSSIRASFTLSAIPLVSIGTLQKFSGDGQTTTSGQSFANPLVVAVTNSNGSAANNVTVSFTASNGASLSATSVNTSSSGQATVYVSAPTTTNQETVTVTASISGLSVTFTLTVNPAGPQLTATGFVNAADQKIGSLSPCSLATVIGAGIAPGIQGTVVGASFGPGLSTLAGASISFSGTTAPIYSISNSGGVQSMTFQVPCEVNAPGNSTVIVTVNGGSAQVSVPVQASSPGIYGALGSDNVLRATLVRQDGSFVSLSNPARRGETVTAFVTGLGPTTPQVGTNQLPPRGATATVNGTVVPGIGVGGVATLVSAQLTTDLVGVYQVSFVVPATLNPGNSVGFSIGLIPVGSTTPQFSNLIYIPVQ